MIGKRLCLFTLLLILLTLQPSVGVTGATMTSKNAVIYPPKLQPGDTVGLVSTAFRVYQDVDLEYAKERLSALGFKVLVGDSVLQRDGYFAGSAEARADDLNRMFANPKVKAIFQVRGGWGSAKVLNRLDYDLIKKNPKIVMGFSDITSLILAIYARTGLVTYHGPTLTNKWPKFTVDHVKQMLVEGKKLTLRNPQEENDDLVQLENRIQTITPGVVEGRLVGGNLSLIVSLLATGYLPDWKDKVLFLEDVGEDVYQIDRMLTQLEMAGVLSQIKGFIFGTCEKCQAQIPFSPYRLLDVLKQHIEPLAIPAWYGSMIGHQPKQFTLPEGALVKIDAGQGTIELLEEPVS